MEKIFIVIPEKIGKINPNIYGHFVEHLGGVIYDGIWVGEDSNIPNINGIRKDTGLPPPFCKLPEKFYSNCYFIPYFSPSPNF